jgi:hypothetical protein
MTNGELQARALAQQLLAQERRNGTAPDDVATDAGRVLETLRARLSQWFGQDGFEALLTRSLDRTRAEIRMRDSVPGVEPPLDIDGGTRVVLTTDSPEQANELVLELLTTFIRLLGRMVGDDMARRLIDHDLPREPDSETNRSSP